MASTTRAAANLLLSVFLLLGLHLAATRAAAQQTQNATARVTGEVRDVGTSAPLYGAVVEIPDRNLRAMTDSAGRFVLPEVPEGEQRWVIRRLGYARWEESAAVRDGAHLVIGLLPSPVALAEIRTAEERLEARRKRSTVSARVVDRDVILTSASGTAFDVVTTHAITGRTLCPGMPGTNSTGTLSSGGGLCVMSRGRVIPVTLCVDDVKADMAALYAYAPQDIYTIETYLGGTEVRVYTNWFVETGQPFRPFIAGCR